MENHCFESMGNFSDIGPLGNSCVTTADMMLSRSLTAVVLSEKKTLTCPGYDHPIQALLVTQSPPDHNSLLTQGLACSYSPIPIYLEGDSTRKHSLFTRRGSLVRGPLFFLRRRSSLKLKYDDINVLGEHPRNMTFFPYLTRLLFLLATLLK